MANNNISGRKKLKTGQRLVIPVQGSNYTKVKSTQRTDNVNSQTNGELSKYTVKKGDTLSSVARRFDTSVNEIKRLNNFKKRKTLNPGQVIMISSRNAEKQQSNSADKETPKKGSKKGKAVAVTTISKKYTVQKGDNLDKIAKKNGVSLDKILEINKLAREDNIHPGQVIIVK
jgi:LysM repeat protein